MKRLTPLWSSGCPEFHLLRLFLGPLFVLVFMVVVVVVVVRCSYASQRGRLCFWSL